MHRIVGLVVVLVVLAWGQVAQGATINWASSVSDSNVTDEGDALAKPDGVIVDDYFDSEVGTTRTATYSGFGAGDNVAYGSSALATPSLQFEKDL